MCVCACSGLSNASQDIKKRVLEALWREDVFRKTLDIAVRSLPPQKSQQEAVVEQRRRRLLVVIENKGLCLVLLTAGFAVGWAAACAMFISRRRNASVTR